MNSLITNLAGWAGMILIVVAYYLLSSKKLKANSFLYNFMNFLGGIGIIINASANKAWPSAVLNVLWSIIAVVSIIKITKTKK